MSKEEFIALFPLEGNITQEIINVADVNDIHECIGALTLKAALGENAKEASHEISWGNSVTGIYLKDSEGIIIMSTGGRIKMMNVTHPQRVKFVIVN